MVLDVADRVVEPPTQKVRRDYVLPKYAGDIDALSS